MIIHTAIAMQQSQWYRDACIQSVGKLRTQHRGQWRYVISFPQNLSKRKLRRVQYISLHVLHLAKGAFTYSILISTVGVPLDSERERYGHHCHHSQPSQRGGFGSKMQRLSMDISHREQDIGSHSGIPTDPLITSHRKYSSSQTSPANTQTSQTGYEDSLNQFNQQQQQDMVLRKRR